MYILMSHYSLVCLTEKKVWWICNPPLEKALGDHLADRNNFCLIWLKFLILRIFIIMIS